MPMLDAFERMAHPYLNTPPKLTQLSGPSDEVDLTAAAFGEQRSLDNRARSTRTSLTYPAGVLRVVLENLPIDLPNGKERSS